MIFRLYRMEEGRQIKKKKMDLSLKRMNMFVWEKDLQPNQVETNKVDQIKADQIKDGLQKKSKNDKKKFYHKKNDWQFNLSNNVV